MSTPQQAYLDRPFSLANEIEYMDGATVSKILFEKPKGQLCLFSFDVGQGLNEHTSPFDAIVQILDGTAKITIGGQAKNVSAGELLIMPATIPHALFAETSRFKMLLTMIRG